MSQQFLAHLSLLAALALPSAVRGSTIEECAGHCNIWIYGASSTEISTIDLKPPQAGTWEGHQGTYYDQQYTLQLAPYVWVSAGTYDGSDPLGPLMFTGWFEFAEKQVWPEVVRFDYYDPPLDPDHPELSKLISVDISGTPPELQGKFWHTRVMWQCTEGITPPLQYSDFPDEEPFRGDPEPSTFVLMGSGVALLTIRRANSYRRRRRRPSRQ